MKFEPGHLIRKHGKVQKYIVHINEHLFSMKPGLNLTMVDLSGKAILAYGTIGKYLKIGTISWPKPCEENWVYEII